MKAWELADLLDTVPRNAEILIQSVPVKDGQMQLTDQVKSFKILANDKPALLLAPGEGSWLQNHSSPALSPSNGHASHSSQSVSPSEGV